MSSSRRCCPPSGPSSYSNFSALADQNTNVQRNSRSNSSCHTSSQNDIRCLSYAELLSNFNPPLDARLSAGRLLTATKTRGSPRRPSSLSGQIYSRARTLRERYRVAAGGGVLEEHLHASAGGASPLDTNTIIRMVGVMVAV